MTIETRDQLITALGNNSDQLILDKASLASQLAGIYCSMWRATGNPAQGAIPTNPAVSTKATLGAISFTNQTAPATNYLANLWAYNSNNTQTLEIHDRIAHNGGLVFNSISTQIINSPIFDLTGLLPSAERMGAANYSDLQWWLEVYTAGGATASNATINVTFNDGTTGNLNTIAVGGTLAASRLYNIDNLKTTAQQSLFIRGVNNVTLSASTGTAGNFGFTCTRPRAALPIPLANFAYTMDWAALGLPNIPNDSCLFPIILPSTTSSGALRGGGKIVHG